MTDWEWGGTTLDRPGENDWAAAAAAAPSLVPNWPGDFADNTAFRAPPSFCPEIDCVRHLVPTSILIKVELRALAIGVGADQVLITSGLISEETYVAALAAHLGMAFDPLFGTPRHQCPSSDEALIRSANTGMLYLEDRDGSHFVVVPRLVDSRRLVELTQQGGDMASRIRLTSSARLRDFVKRHSTATIAHRAADALAEDHPELSAGVARRQRLRLLSILAFAAAVAFAAPVAALSAVEVTLATVFVAWTGLRLLGLLTERLSRRRSRPHSDHQLPLYSVIIALYREAAAVPGLIGALRALDYPPEKLDIKLVLEPGDDETIDAIRKLQLGPPFEIVIAPDRGPQTKPKALNAALPFVRGKFVAVFDAEDRPERGQIRSALEAFTAGSTRLACVQARLTIDNTADSWLTRGIMAQTPQGIDPALP
jgi:hypothetical protein